MGWPQITYIVLLAMSGGIVMVKHGEPREPWSFWMWLFSAAITMTLLIAGGFFSEK